jgi:hypothetical protein
MGGSNRGEVAIQTFQSEEKPFASIFIVFQGI